MKLAKDSWVIWWAYFLDGPAGKVPRQTHLCAVFWRVVLMTLVCVGFPVFAVSMIGLGMWASYQRDADRFLRETGITVFVVLAGCGLVIAGFLLYHAGMRTGLWKMLKDRYCPLIDVVGADRDVTETETP